MKGIMYTIIKEGCGYGRYDTCNYFMLIACALHNFRLKCRNLIPYTELV